MYYGFQLVIKLHWALGHTGDIHFRENELPWEVEDATAQLWFGTEARIQACDLFTLFTRNVTLVL